MSRCGSFLPALVAAGLLAACGDSTGPQISAELVGTWEATPACLPQGCHLTLRAAGVPDLNVTQAGVATTVVIAANGTITVIAPGISTSGTVRTEGNRLIVRAPDGTEETIQFSLTGNMLTLQFQAFNFTWPDGQTRLSTATGVFLRRP